jgi:hypothetical protein
MFQRVGAAGRGAFVLVILAAACGGPADDSSGPAAFRGGAGVGGVSVPVGDGGAVSSGSVMAASGSTPTVGAGSGGQSGGPSAAMSSAGNTSAAGAMGGAAGSTLSVDAGMHEAAGTGGSAATAGAGGSIGAGGSVAMGSTFHVFLLLGQSNMAGYPKANEADKVKDERIKVLGYDDCAATGRQQDKWDVAVPPLHECWNGALGPGDYFAKTLIEKLPAGDTIGLVPCAISGEKIETFLKVGGSKYQWILSRAKLAQQAGGVIDGLLFHQGESNNGDPTWPGKVNTLVTDLRTDLGIGEVPFLAGELAYDGGCAGHNKLVNMLPATVSHAYVVSASGLALDPADTQWHLHFGHDPQVMFGQRYAAKMIEALGL